MKSILISKIRKTKISILHDVVCTHQFSHHIVENYDITGRLVLFFREIKGKI